MNSVADKSSDSFLPASSVWARYSVTAMTIHRWLADPELAFPKPLYLGRFRFWRIAELEVWEAGRPRSPRPPENRDTFTIGRPPLASQRARPIARTAR